MYLVVDFKCEDCEEKKENWVCLTCGKFYCSRYINSHFLKHHEKEGHNVCISMMDLSYWCYKCESYIANKHMNKWYKIISDTKFGNNFEANIDSVTNALEALDLDNKKVVDIKYQNFIELLKNGKIKNISFMTGAGISTTAGIPDFRSSEGGLFKLMQEKYLLSTPEEFFYIDTFYKTPQLFYDFAKEFDVQKCKPTPTHVI